MLAPVKVVNPRVMDDRYPQQDHRQRRKRMPHKPRQKTRNPKTKDNKHIDITA